MRYYKSVMLKDGRECVLRNCEKSDGEAVLINFLTTHSESDNLRTYPEECSMTAADEGDYLAAKAESPDEIELCAVVDGKIVGTAGVDSMGTAFKTRHRADFGISIERAYWGLGIGRALTEACIECAEKAGYSQLELSVVSGNDAAEALYKKVGFVEFGRNPRGFFSKESGWQELVSMLLILK